MLFLPAIARFLAAIFGEGGLSTSLKGAGAAAGRTTWADAATKANPQQIMAHWMAGGTGIPGGGGGGRGGIPGMGGTMGGEGDKNRKKENEEIKRGLLLRAKEHIWQTATNYAGYKLVDMLSGGLFSSLSKFAQGVSDSNRELAQWNAGLAASFARLDIRQQRIQIQRAGVTQDSAKFLNEQLGDMLEAVEPLKDIALQATNYLAGGAAYLASYLPMLAKIGGGILGPVLDIAEEANKRKTVFKQDDLGRKGLRELRNLSPGREPGERPDNLGGVQPRQPLPRLLGK